MSFGLSVLVALLLLVVPGAIVGLAARLPWPAAVASGPALTYGVVGLAIIPYGAVGIPWNGWTALAALAVVTAVVIGFRLLLSVRTPSAQTPPDRAAQDRTPSARTPETPALWPVLTVAAGIALGAAIIGCAAVSGLPHWQSVPSTWDAVWHANTVRYILDTGQASSTQMGALRNVETHATLYYPSAFHALVAVSSQLTGWAPTTAYTLGSLAAAVWLFPVSAAVLTWQLLWATTSPWRTAGAAAAAAALSASFSALPYVEFDTAAMPNLAAYGVAAPTAVLIVSALRHRDRVPVAVLALIGVFSVHTTGGVVVALFVAAWWLFEGLWHPVRSRRQDVLTLLAVVVPTIAVLAPQFVGILRQADIIVGHAFVTHQGKKRALFDAVFQHTRHLNDYPVQYALIALAAIGGLMLLVRRIWWPLAVWLLLVVSIVHSSAPFGGVLGVLTGRFSDFFYSDPRRLSAVITLLLAPMAGIASFTIVSAAVRGLREFAERRTAPHPPQADRRTAPHPPQDVHRTAPHPPQADRRTAPPARHLLHKLADRRAAYAMTAALLVAVSLGYAWHYFPRHRHLIGEKYDSVMVSRKDLDAMAYLATLPGARDTLIGDANTDGTAWMYAVAGLHPLWTHYDYPVQQGPGYHRFIFWAYADDADRDPRVADAVRALNIRYVLTSTTVVRGFVMPDGLVSLDKSRSWVKIYDNSVARIYEWRGSRPSDKPGAS